MRRKKIRCTFGGSTVWAALPFSPLMPKVAGLKLGSLGRVSTSCGSTLPGDLLTRTEQSEAAAQFDTADGDILISYHLGSGVREPLSQPQIFGIGPKGFEKPVHVQKVAPRVYQGRLHIGHISGLFRIRPVIESPAFPETGLYRQEEELQDYGSNPALLAQISRLTGGRFNPTPDSVFDSGGRSLYTAWQLWPGLLALAIALTDRGTHHAEVEWRGAVLSKCTTLSKWYVRGNKSISVSRSIR